MKNYASLGTSHRPIGHQAASSIGGHHCQSILLFFIHPVAA
jgi:hypothetical protein